MRLSSVSITAREKDLVSVSPPHYMSEVINTVAGKGAIAINCNGKLSYFNCIPPWEYIAVNVAQLFAL